MLTTASTVVRSSQHIGGRGWPRPSWRALLLASSPKLSEQEVRELVRLAVSLYSPSGVIATLERADRSYLKCASLSTRQSRYPKYWVRYCGRWLYVSRCTRLTGREQPLAKLRYNTVASVQEQKFPRFTRGLCAPVWVSSTVRP